MVMVGDSGGNVQGRLEPVKVARDVVGNVQFGGSKVLYKALFRGDERHAHTHNDSTRAILPEQPSWGFYTQNWSTRPCNAT